MGVRKRILETYYNKRRYPLIKMYSFYRRDIWGYLRWKRYYVYRKALVEIMKTKRRFYYRVLYELYGGVKFYMRKYKYLGNLMFVKKRIKLFYGGLKDSLIGKYGSIVKGKLGGSLKHLNYFFFMLESRLDVLLYRSLYSYTVRFSRNIIVQGYVYLNYLVCKKFYKQVQIGDLVCVNHRPLGLFFFQYLETTNVDLFEETFSDYYDFMDYMYLNKTYYRYETLMLREFLLGVNFLDSELSEQEWFEESYYFIFLFFLNLFLRWMMKNNGFVLNDKNNKLLLKNPLFFFSCFTIMHILDILIDCYWNNDRLLVNYLYGFRNLKLRLFVFYKRLKPRIRKRVRKMKRSPKYFRIFAQNKPRMRKVFRYWRISKPVFNFLKNIKRINFVFVSYPSYLEVNYKLHMFVFYKLPSINSIFYPFGSRPKLFFDYFKLKGYF